MNLIDMERKVEAMWRKLQNLRLDGGKGVRVASRNSPEAFTATIEAVPQARSMQADGAADVLFLVTLLSDGGNNGGIVPGTAPTWTYTVMQYGTGTTLKKNSAGANATAMSPIKPRLPSSAAAATVGMAIRKSNGDLVLVEAFEDYAKGLCNA